MNVKDSHCMSKVRYILLFCLLSCSVQLGARTFGDLARRSFWQGSRNVAGIRQDSLSRSYAEIFGRYEDGGFMNTWDAPRGWSAGAVTGSVLHFERISFTGLFSFDQDEGYDMCGSMFARPGYFPIDVMEFTPGRKTMQTYAFDGGVAYDLNGSWSLGVRMDFESSNIAKRKDLRYAGWRLDMSVAPGLIYRSGDLAFGLSPFMRKVSETIDAQQIGTSESSYYAFFDKGLMYGVHQVWTGSGVHLQEPGVNGLPVREYSYGGAVQAQYGGLYADLEIFASSGVSGEKEYIWFEFPGMGLSSQLRYRLSDGGREHHMSLGFDWKRQDMDENILEKVSNNGVVDVLNHGSNRILSRQMWSLVPEYEFVSPGVEVLASLGIEGYDGMSFQMYPFVNTLSLTDLSTQVRTLVRLGNFDLKVGLMGSKGFMEEGSRTVGNGSAVTEPYRLQDWYERQMEYMTAFRTVTEISLRYNFSAGLYLEASGDWMHGYGVSLTGGSNRFGAAFKIGYDF